MDGKAERDRKRAEERRLLREAWGRCCLLYRRKQTVGCSAQCISVLFWLFRKQEIREITFRGALCISANCIKGDPQLLPQCQKAGMAGPSTMVGDVRLWRTKV